MSRSANALLLVAAVSSKAAFPTHKAIFRAEDVIHWLKVKALVLPKYRLGNLRFAR